jgi:hypothetical protein
MGHHPVAGQLPTTRWSIPCQSGDIDFPVVLWIGSCYNSVGPLEQCASVILVPQAPHSGASACCMDVTLLTLPLHIVPRMESVLLLYSLVQRSVDTQMSSILYTGVQSAVSFRSRWCLAFTFCRISTILSSFSCSLLGGRAWSQPSTFNYNTVTDFHTTNHYTLLSLLSLLSLFASWQWISTVEILQLLCSRHCPLANTQQLNCQLSYSTISSQPTLQNSADSLP